MKTNVTFRIPLFLAVAALAAGAVALHGSDARNTNRNPKAADPKSADAKNTPRPPLHLAIDRKPINRDAPDRISYAPIVKRTAASVVFVYSSKKVPHPDISPFLNDPLFRRFFDVPGAGNGGGGDDLTPGANPRGNRGNRGGRGGGGGGRRSVPDQVQRGLGSGIVISADGYILTNNHVVEGADEVQVSIGESTKKYDAKVIGRDTLVDIAVVKIDATGLTPATFGDSDQLEVGDVVLAIGNPFGLGQSVSRGIVSALGRGDLGIEQMEDFIQTDAAINPGNSGGALLDSDGRVVGINTAILTGGGGFAGVGFAIPANLVRSLAEQIVSTGKVDRGYLGVRLQDFDEDLKSEFKTDKGALVSDVEPDSPADKAGLKSGDVITKINGTDVRDGRHLQLTISQLAPDSQVTLDLLREGKPKTLTVKLGHRPDQETARNDTETNKDEGVLNGVGVGDITRDVRDQFDIPANIRGAIITSVEADSPSAQQGLREGDVILELDRKPVHNADEAVKLSEEIKGPKVTVRLWRNGGSRYVVVDESKK
jgi:serine protease Do